MLWMVSRSASDRDTQQLPGVRRRGANRVSQLIDRHSVALAGAVLLVVGAGLLAFVAKVLDLGNGAILVIAFLGPLLAYLILTGQLSEIGAGGVNLKFREAARKPVEAAVTLVTEEAQTIEKAGPEAMRRIDALDLEAPVVLTLTLAPRRGKYDFYALQAYVQRLERHPRFRFVIFLDHDGRVVGYLPSEVLARKLEGATTTKPFLNAVNAGYLPRDASVRTEFLTPDTTTEEAAIAHDDAQPRRDARPRRRRQAGGYGRTRRYSRAARARRRAQLKLKPRDWHTLWPPRVAGRASEAWLQDPGASVGNRRHDGGLGR